RVALVLLDRGFEPAALVAALPLDHQFGLDRGFDVSSDRLGGGPDGRPANERPAWVVISEAIDWLTKIGALSQSAPPAPPAGPAPAAPPAQFFLWVHLFEPHAPYGEDSTRPVLDRYQDEIATADREIGRLLNALADRRADTIVVAAGDHGEAFGEHGEYAHSIFVYDTTLRVPLIMRIAGGRAGRRVADPVSLVDVAPTVMRAVGGEMKDADGIDLAPALGGSPLPNREL